jgi:hypothetical protein
MAAARNWYIWYDRMPGDEPDNILRLEAECHFETTGNRVDLEPRNIGTGDGTELAFEVVVTSSDVPINTPEIVKISERILTDGRVKSVRILDEDTWATYPVDEPS